MIFFDTETCGLCGPAVLIQWAEDDGPINLHSVWTNPIYETLELIEKIVKADICGFNLSFDWFQICKLYTVLTLVPDDWYPIDHIEEIALKEPIGRDGPCLKPKSACDLMLHARKGPYQSTMDRHDIKIKRVPTQLAFALVEELNNRIKFKDLYFARKQNKKKRWEVVDIEDDPDFKNIVIKFQPSSALKVLAADALGVDPLLIKDVGVDSKFTPNELGYAPFALAVGKWNWSWPEVIQHHIEHWAYYEKARRYASDDVKYTRDLYKFFGSPEPGDDDSELACCVAACRWRGYKVDIEGIKNLKLQAAAKKYNKEGKVIPTAPHTSRLYITEVMTDKEKLILKDSTKKILLEEVANWEDHPAASRAKEVLRARQAQYEEDFYEKLIVAGRLHADFKVIGALSSRMAGGGGLNAQGIKKEKGVRKQFPLAFHPYILCGGDFASFEVTLAEAYFNDPKLREMLLSGKKIHGIFGTFFYPGMTYEDILATEGTEQDLYTRAKSGLFATLYGGTVFTLMERLGITEEAATAGIEMFARAFPGVGKRREEIKNNFCSMRQPGGIGTQVEWHEPAEYVESMFGFRRYFTLENQVCKTLFQLAQKPPPSWRNIKVKVQRRERLQTASGALQSALYAAAFAIQAANMRAAGNHIIQSSGATITKAVQRAIWDLQPTGEIEKWIVQPMNIHDEVLCPTIPGVEQKVEETVQNVVERYKERVPLLEIGWKSGLSSWAEK